MDYNMMSFVVSWAIEQSFSTIGTKYICLRATSGIFPLQNSMEKLLFDVDPQSIGVMVESDHGEGEDAYLPVMMFNIKITG